MLTRTMIKNSIFLFKTYCPNLFLYLTEKEFETFLSKAFKHTTENNNGTPNNNFIVTFFELLREHRYNHSQIIKSEFRYFNYLLGEFKNYSNAKEFKNLLKGALYNFKQSNFHHALGEIAACLDFSSKYEFKKYEKSVGIKKSIDLEFQTDEKEFLLIEVFTIDFDKTRYESEKFKKYFDGKLKDKFESKTMDLDLTLKRKISLFPILSGFTVEIIREQSHYLKTICNSTFDSEGFQTYVPKAFGNIQGTFFNLFTIDEIIDPELIKKNYSQHAV